MCVYLCSCPTMWNHENKLWNLFLIAFSHSLPTFVQYEGIKFSDTLESKLVSYTNLDAGRISELMKQNSLEVTISFAS